MTLRPTVAQLFLLEIAAAVIVGGLALGDAYRLAGIAVGAVLAVLALGRWQRRWLFQVLLSALGLATRRRARRQPGLSGVLGSYQVESVPGGGREPTIGAVRSATTWCVPLLLALDDVLNEDAPVPVRVLADLLQVEDVPVASVRLLTLVTPARRAPREGADTALAQLASRYLLLTVDGTHAADAWAARGGSRAGVHQMLRRCVLHAEELLANAGVGMRRLDEVAVAALFATWLGPAAPSSGRRAAQAAEGWTHLTVAGTWSTAFAVTGTGSDVGERVQRLAAAAPTPIAATALLLLPGARPGRPAATWVLRLSAPQPVADAGTALAALADPLGLLVQPGGGEQAPLLRATMPVGVTSHATSVPSPGVPAGRTQRPALAGART